MGKCYLKGELGDQINVTLAAAAYNLRQWIRLRLDSFFILFFIAVRLTFTIFLQHIDIRYNNQLISFRDSKF